MEECNLDVVDNTKLKLKLKRCNFPSLPTPLQFVMVLIWQNNLLKYKEGYEFTKS